MQATTERMSSTQGTHSSPALIEQAAGLPQVPGVYMFMGDSPLPLYIGKSINIRTRVQILFDHNGDGAKFATGWLDGSDAWLVRDISKNGTIDSGLELFGVDTDITVAGVTRKATSGFEALAALNTNGDTVFDVNDGDAFIELRLWQDLNQNGISDAGELSTLAEKGIVSIGLTVTSTNTNLGNGNTVTGKAVVNRLNGQCASEKVPLSVKRKPHSRGLAGHFSRCLTRSETACCIRTAESPWL